ncbi:MAG: tRNA 2-thiouridine(34) synthase MnmA [Bacilli bacterium]|nr:tRNA 2-thiouridine(34) synthase MnmA [Bacilli bacterium]
MMARVFLGLSGGVDSAVALKLLLDQKHEVVCGFMRNWDSTANNDFLGNPTINDDNCPQEIDYNDAMKVAQQFNVELVRIDFVREYWEEVFAYFIDEYKKGRTPNPDILCNKYIKFDHFLKYAKEHNFDYIAMGHYAGVEHTDKGSFLIKAKDTNKDQTYFLCQLNQDQLEMSLFPLTNYTKPEIREIANKLDLNVARKKDSTGICFIGERDFKKFLTNYIPAQKGKIVDYETNKVIGEHSGVMYYTIGQSKGLGIGGQKDFNDGKWYVVGKSISKKILYVSNDPSHILLKSDEVIVNDIIINNKKFVKIEQCTAKFRYRSRECSVTIKWLDDTTAILKGDNLIESITPGQACALYKDKYCIGGGFINQVFYKGQEKNYE